jgi:hypothetical protein
MTIRRIKRREFIAVLGGLVAWPAAVRAQGSDGRVARVAYLGPTSPSALDPSPDRAVQARLGREWVG